MQHIKSVEFDGGILEYYILDSDDSFGICAKFNEAISNVYDLSDDYDFVYNLAISLAESFTMPEYLQELCEEALFEASFIEFIEEEK